MIMNLLRVVVVVALPLACLFFARHLAGPGAELIAGKEIGALCDLQVMLREPGRETECLATDWLWLFRLLALSALGIAVLPVVVFLSSAAMCGTSRWANAAVFRRLIPLAILLVCVNLLVQGALLLMGVAAFYVSFIGNPPLGALAAAAVGIFGATTGVVAGAATMQVDPVLPVRALALERKRAPVLWELVDEIAEQLGSEKPDTILVGMEVNFWVVSGVVESVGSGLAGRYRGRTLYVSLPLMRVLSMAEFSAIIGHELGHFRGRDSEYSARFLPVYAAVDGAKYGMDDYSEFAQPGPPLAILLATVSRYPAKALLSMLSASFHGNVSRISRKREFEADRAATEVADDRAVVTALFKIPLYDRLWDDVVEDHADRIILRKPLTAHLSRYFDDLARLLVTPEHAEVLRNYALKAKAEHPYDSHPTSLNRAKALGVNAKEITAEELRPKADDGVLDTLLDDDMIEEAEAALLGAEHDHLKAVGRIPETPSIIRRQKIDPLYRAVYSLMAWLVRGAPDPAIRFGAAVKAGNAELTEFDRMIFAEFCRGWRDCMSPEEAVEMIHERTGADGAVLMFELLEAVIAPEYDTDPAAPELMNWLYAALGVAEEPAGEADAETPASAAPAPAEPGTEAAADAEEDLSLSLLPAADAGDAQDDEGDELALKAAQPPTIRARRTDDTGEPWVLVPLIPDSIYADPRFEHIFRMAESIGGYDRSDLARTCTWHPTTAIGARDAGVTYYEDDGTDRDTRDPAYVEAIFRLFMELGEMVEAGKADGAEIARRLELLETFLRDSARTEPSPTA